MKGDKVMREIKQIVEKKVGRAYEVQTVITDKATIHESLMKELIAKKLHQCRWIKSIRDSCNYDGTRDITVTYDNGFRSVYTVEA